MSNRSLLKKDTFVVLKTLRGGALVARVIKDSGETIEVKHYIRTSHRWTKSSLRIPYEDVKRVLWRWPVRYSDQ